MSTISSSDANELGAKESIDDILCFSAVRNDAKLAFVECINAVRGKKSVFVDKQLHGLILNLVDDVQKFNKENSLSCLSPLDIQLQSYQEAKDATENVLYLVNANLEAVEMIADHIKLTSSAGMLTILLHDSTTTL